MIDPEYLLLSALTQDPAACLPLSLEPHHLRASVAPALYVAMRALATQGNPFGRLAVRDAGREAVAWCRLLMLVMFGG